MMNSRLTGDAIRFQLENYGCDDYEELILGYIAEITDIDYDDIKNSIKVKLYPAENQKIIEFIGDEENLYNLMVELSHIGHKPMTRYPSLKYTYDLLGSKIEVIPSINNDEGNGLF